MEKTKHGAKPGASDRQSRHSPAEHREDQLFSAYELDRNKPEVTCSQSGNNGFRNKQQSRIGKGSDEVYSSLEDGGSELKVSTTAGPWFFSSHRFLSAILGFTSSSFRKQRISARRNQKIFMILFIALIILLIVRQRSVVMRHQAFLKSYEHFRYTYVQSDMSGAVVVSPLCVSFPTQSSLLSRIRFRLRGIPYANFETNDQMLTDVTATLLTTVDKPACATLVTHNTQSVVDLKSQLCDKYEDRVLKDAKLPMLKQIPLSNFVKLYFGQRIAWIEEETVFMVFRKPSSVDHEDLFEQMGMVAHIKNNPTMYQLQSSPESMVLLFDFDYKGFAKENPYWAEYASSILYPGRIDFTAPYQVKMKGIIRGRSNASLPALRDALTRGKELVCFRKAILPSRLHDKLVTLNNEIWESPSYPANINYLANRNVPARDWTFVRSQVFKKLGIVEQTKLKPLVIYLRRSKFRKFDKSSEQLFIDFATSISAKRKFDLKVVDFDFSKFGDQVRAVSDCAMLIGMHGHSLLSTLFMQPRAVLIEIFPMGFQSTLYTEGVGRRLKYFPVHLSAAAQAEAVDKEGATADSSLGSSNSSVQPFYYPGLSRFQGSREECMRRDPDCLAFYRSDTGVLRFSNSDIELMRSRLARAFNHLDDVFFPEHRQAITEADPAHGSSSLTTDANDF